MPEKNPASSSQPQSPVGWLGAPGVATACISPQTKCAAATEFPSELHLACCGCWAQWAMGWRFFQERFLTSHDLRQPLSACGQASCTTACSPRASSRCPCEQAAATRRPPTALRGALSACLQRAPAADLTCAHGITQVVQWNVPYKGPCLARRGAVQPLELLWCAALCEDTQTLRECVMHRTHVLVTTKRNETA